MGKSEMAFQRKLEAAQHPRWRKHKVRRHDQTPEYIRPRSQVEAVLQDWRTETADQRLAWARRCSVPEDPLCRRAPVVDVVGGGVLAAECLVIAAAQDLTEGIKRKIVAYRDREKRAAALEKRRARYAAENARRRKRAAELRNAVPPPANPCPSVAELEMAYAERGRGNPQRERFGRLMIDLEEHVAYKVRNINGRIVGVSGGVREWLKANSPLLSQHYHTCLRFKRFAQHDPARVGEENHIDGVTDRFAGDEAEERQRAWRDGKDLENGAPEAAQDLQVTEVDAKDLQAREGCDAQDLQGKAERCKSSAVERDDEKEVWTRGVQILRGILGAVGAIRFLSMARRRGFGLRAG